MSMRQGLEYTMYSRTIRLYHPSSLESGAKMMGNMISEILGKLLGQSLPFDTQMQDFC